MKYLLSILLAVMLVGCATFEVTAYRTIATTTATVDVAMNSWGEAVRSGLTTPEQQAKVRKLYDEYDSLAKTARALAISYKSNPDKNGLSQAVDAAVAAAAPLVEVIHTFKGK